MSTLTEIKQAIDRLNPHNRAVLTAELFASIAEPSADDPELKEALVRGLTDVQAGRVRPLEDARGMISEWISKS